MPSLALLVDVSRSVGASWPGIRDQDLPLPWCSQIFFPIVAAIWGVIAVLFSIFSVYRGRSGVFVFSSALLAVSMSMLMVAIQLVTHNTMDVRVKVAIAQSPAPLPSFPLPVLFLGLDTMCL